MAKYKFGGLQAEAITALGAIVVFLFFWVIGVVIGSFTIPYILNSWLEVFGKEPKVLWWHGALLGMVPYIGYGSIVLSIVTWVLMLFLN